MFEKMKKSIKQLVSIAAAAALLVLVIGSCTESYATGIYGVDLSSAGYKTPNPYSSPQCTWYCWGRAYEKLGISLPNWHHAKQWDEYAASDPNYRVGTEARENSIMVESYDDGDGFGHVMFVEKVENGYAYITEGNWLGAQYHEDRINLSTRVRDSWQSHVMHEDIKYIYLGCTEHKWDKGKITKKVKHTKTQLVDGEKTYTCTVCGETKNEVIKASHSYKTTKTTAATLKKNGSVKKKCSECGKTKTITIYRPKTIKAKNSVAVYTGHSLKPGVIVKDVKGSKILKQYYTVSYKNNKKLGTATATVKFKGKYSGSKSISFKIVPKGAKLIECTGGSKSIKVTWKRVKGIDGYQIQYATKKSFSNKKTVTVKGSKSLSKTIKKLSAGTTYYVRVRTYKTANNKKHYSKWSNVMSAKTKIATSKELYKPVIKEYQSLLDDISNGYSMDPYDEQDNYKYVYWEIASAAYNDGIYPEYSICDINNDGVDELVVGGYKYGRYFIGSIFTLNSINDPVCLINCKSYMYRGEIKIYQNGYIEDDGSGGADYHEWIFYKIDGSKAKLVLMEKYILNGNSMTINGNEISEDKFYETINLKESANKKSMSWNYF